MTNEEKIAALEAELAAKSTEAERLAAENAVLQEDLDLAINGRRVEVAELPPQASLADCNRKAHEASRLQAEHADKVAKAASEAAKKAALAITATEPETV